MFHILCFLGTSLMAITAFGAVAALTGDVTTVSLVVAGFTSVLLAYRFGMDAGGGTGQFLWAATLFFGIQWGFGASLVALGIGGLMNFAVAFAGLAGMMVFDSREVPNRWFNLFRVGVAAQVVTLWLIAPTLAGSHMLARDALERLLW